MTLPVTGSGATSSAGSARATTIQTLTASGASVAAGAATASSAIVVSASGWTTSAGSANATLLVTPETAMRVRRTQTMEAVNLTMRRVDRFPVMEPVGQSMY